MVEVKENLVRRAGNPLFISAVLCAFLVYSGIAPVKTNRYDSSGRNIIRIHGYISGSPSITMNRKIYRSSLNMNSCTEKMACGNITYSCSSQVPLYIPSLIVESLYPGRLFSLSREKIVFEKGAEVCLSGSFSKDGIFYVNKAEFLGFKSGISGKLLEVRAFCRMKFRALMFSWGKCGAFILSLLSGSREYLEDGLLDKFSKAGLSHILALSGMHLSFFASLSGGIGQRFFGKKFSFWARFAGILFFSWFAGLSPSLSRALICSIVMLFSGLLFCIEPDYFIVLSFSFLIHSVFIPDDIFTPAFMLSYGALGGILFFSDLFRWLFGYVLCEKLAASFSASLGAQLATFPISVKLFGGACPIGVVSSVIVSPIVTVFLTVSVFAVLFCFIFPDAERIACCILNSFYRVIIYFVDFFSSFSKK